MKNPYNTSYDSRTIVFGNQNAGHHYWIGLLSNGYDYFAGQTFTSPADGTLKSIRIYPQMIVGNTGVKINVYRFDKENQQCREKLAETRINVDASKANSWVSFSDLNLDVEKNKKYMFKLSCDRGNMVALAECGWGNATSNVEGEQWVGNSENTDGHFHRGFGLSFLAEMESIQRRI